MRGSERAVGVTDLPERWIATVSVLLGVAGIRRCFSYELSRIVDFPKDWLRRVIECAAALLLRQSYRSVLALVPSMAMDLANIAPRRVVDAKSTPIGTNTVTHFAVLVAVAFAPLGDLYLVAGVAATMAVGVVFVRMFAARVPRLGWPRWRHASNNHIAPPHR